MNMIKHFFRGFFLEGVGNWELVNPVGIYVEPNGTLQSHCSTILTPLHHCTCSVVQGLCVCRREFPDPIWSDYLISASQCLRRNAPSNRTQPWDSLLERGGRGGRGLGGDSYDECVYVLDCLSNQEARSVYGSC